MQRKAYAAPSFMSHKSLTFGTGTISFIDPTDPLDPNDDKDYWTNGQWVDSDNDGDVPRT